MRRRFNALPLVLTITLGGASRVEAQSPTGLEVGIQGLALLQDPAWLGGGLYAGWRPEGKTRLALTINAGAVDHQTSGRAELMAQYLLSPGRMKGAGVYGFGGIAGEVGRRDQGYLVAGLGIESRPGGSSGWSLEAGVGGGARISVGWRHRWLRRPDRF